MADSDWMNQEPRTAIDLGQDRPHGARVYDYILGGKTNYPADREQAAKVLATIPGAATAARENRGFMQRAVALLAGEYGIRQFLDIGTGIPTSPNLHEVVQGVAPEAHITYADNDPIVLAHSRALHMGTPEGRTTYIEADATDPEYILGHEDFREITDPAKPLAITLFLLLHWLPEEYDAYGMVRRLTDGLPVGSALAITHITADFDKKIAGIEEDFKGTGSSVRTRTKAEVGAFFDMPGWELVDPGLRPPHRWRPNAPEIGSADAVRDEDVPVWAGVAVKTS